MRKYRPGRKLSMVALVNRLLRGEYVFLRDKPMHPGFMLSMQLNTLSWRCRIGHIRAAINNERKQ